MWVFSAVFELSLFHSHYHQQRNVELNSTAMHKLNEIEDRVQLDEIEDRVRLDEVEVPVLSNRQKYNMLLLVTLSIASLSACHGTNQFQAYLKGMKEVERIYDLVLPLKNVRYLLRALVHLFKLNQIQHK